MFLELKDLAGPFPPFANRLDFMKSLGADDSQKKKRLDRKTQMAEVEFQEIS